MTREWRAGRGGGGWGGEARSAGLLVRSALFSSSLTPTGFMLHSFEWIQGFETGDCSVVGPCNAG